MWGCLVLFSSCALPVLSRAEGGSNVWLECGMLRMCALCFFFLFYLAQMNLSTSQSKLRLDSVESEAVRHV